MKIVTVSAEYVRAPLGSEFRPTWNTGVVQDAIATVLIRVETDIQADAAFSEGLWGCRKIAAVAEAFGLPFIPHTWSNGIGLLANAHLPAAAPNCAWLEIPDDPPAFTHEGRDRLLAESLRIDPDGLVRLPDRLGIVLDEDFLASYRAADR